jgi:hypothetical protein
MAESIGSSRRVKARLEEGEMIVGRVMAQAASRGAEWWAGEAGRSGTRWRLNRGRPARGGRKS